MTQDRNYTALDRLLSRADRALRTLTPGSTQAGRASPAQALDMSSEDQLDEEERQHVAGLMRINHTGEVCAQALYQGQASTATLPDIRHAMEEAAREEEDHLAWCEGRIRELDSTPSRLNPIFYAMSYTLGAAAGLAGDRWSLGFVAETENQVVRHLERHLERLPEQDHRSRAILVQMRTDELQHAVTATDAGGAPLPSPVRRLMALTSKLMTWTTYRL